MKNKYINYYDGVIALEVDGACKYGLNALISEDRLPLVMNATNDYWKVVEINNSYYVYTIKDDKVIFLHNLISGINNNLIEEKFILGNNSKKLISNPFKDMDLVTHRNNNGLINTDENLIITDNLVIVENDIDYSRYLVGTFFSLYDEEIYDVSLHTIVNLDDELMKNKALSEFKKYLEMLNEDKIIKRVFKELKQYLTIIKLYEEGKLTGDDLKDCPFSIKALADVCYDISEEHKSNYYFNGHVIKVYPSIKYVKAAKRHICSFSGSVIHKGQEHVTYKLFIEDLTDDTCYISDTIRMEIGYEEYLPTTALQLDDFLYKLSKSYERDFDNYYNFLCNTKSDNLGLKILYKR